MGSILTILLDKWRGTPISIFDEDEEKPASSHNQSRDDMQWCVCEKMQEDFTINEKVCCRNPKIFEDDVLMAKRV